MEDRFKFRIWNGTEMHYNDFVVTATGFVGKITEEFLGRCVFNQEDLTADNECVLMQCTGSKDKNGKLIYEGDILKGRWGNIKPVTFECGCFFWGVEEGSYWISSDCKMEIIGNIYENEELLND